MRSCSVQKLCSNTKTEWMHSYGRVYRGSYKGEPVAVKVIEDAARVRLVNGEAF